MLDINLFDIEQVSFRNKKTNYYVKQGKNKIVFYVRKTINITPITCYNYKYNIIIKIDDRTKEIIESIEKKFIAENKIKEEDYMTIIKQNDKGNVIKLKLENRYHRLTTELFDEDTDAMCSDDLEKFSKINCAIDIRNFWNFNGKYGLLVYAKKIYKLR